MIQWEMGIASTKALKSWIVPSTSPYLPSWVHDFTTGSLELLTGVEKPFHSILQFGSSHAIIRRIG